MLKGLPHAQGYSASLITLSVHGVVTLTALNYPPTHYYITVVSFNVHVYQLLKQLLRL
jgi:hypothetical protein